MIAWLRGVVRDRGEESVVLDVHGVGWLVTVSRADAAALPDGEPAELLIHMVVREDAMQLYGFRTAAARELFVALTSVPGVGPKGAMALLGDSAPELVARAIHDEDVRTLTKAKGVGKRTAELIVVKLRERLPTSLLDAPSSAAAPATGPAQRVQADVESALVHLGYRPADARAAVTAVLADGVDPSVDFDRLLRSALALLRRDASKAGGGGR